ncbi:MAG: Na+/H+ antiporter NhaA, partial [Rhodococcus sp.]|nr:Na+/H+ antiporter NhaA [Rhodococcus sp. (in: high G+C Gram-positive bacteria)]
MADQITPTDRPMARFVERISRARGEKNSETLAAGFLLAATLIALIWANSPLGDTYQSFWHTELSITVGEHGISLDLAHWVNDGLMALFFFVVGLEV